MPRHAPRLSALAAAMLLSALPCAPGAAADQAAIPTVTVALAEQRGLFEHGRSAVYRGVADEQGVAFVIPALTINTAAALVLQAGETGAPMRLQLKNDFSEDWDRSLDTGREGALLTRFRTEGPAVALVSSVARRPTARPGLGSSRSHLPRLRTPSRTAGPVVVSLHEQPRDVLVEHASDEGLVGHPLLERPRLQVVEVSGRESMLILRSLTPVARAASRMRASSSFVATDVSSPRS